MAKETNINLSIQTRKGMLRYTFQPGSVSISMATTGLESGTVIVGTTAYEAVPYGHIASPRMLFGRNLDAANYVELGRSTSTGSTVVHVVSRIKAGDLYLVPGSTAAKGLLKWKANTAAVRIHHHVLEL